MVNRPILQTITSHHLKGRFSIRTVVSRFGAFALLSIYTWSHGSNWKYQIYFFLKIFKIQIYKIQRTPDLGAPTPDYSASFTLMRGGLWWMPWVLSEFFLIPEQFENKYVNSSLPWPPKSDRPIASWSQRWCHLIVTYMSNWWTNPLKDLKLILNWIITAKIKSNVYIRIKGTTPNFSPNNLGILSIRNGPISRFIFWNLNQSIKTKNKKIK